MSEDLPETFFEDVAAAEWRASRSHLQLECWFCGQPAMTVGWGFAVCSPRADGSAACAEKARVSARYQTGKP